MAFMIPFVPYMLGTAAVLSAVGAIQQGKAAKAAGDYNAQINLQNAEAARAQSRMQVSQQQRETTLRLGAVRAAHGASGGTNEGSVLDVIGDVAAQSELERQSIVYEGEMAARGYTNTAQLDKAQGKAAQRASYLTAGSELLSGGASAVFASAKLKKT